MPDRAAQHLGQHDVVQGRPQQVHREREGVQAFAKKFGDNASMPDRPTPKPGETTGAGGGDSKGEPKKLSATDQQALDWANANPKDPRAAQIKTRLGQ